MNRGRNHRERERRAVRIEGLSPAPRPTAWTDRAWVRWGANRSPDVDRWFAMTRYSRFVT